MKLLMIDTSNNQKVVARLKADGKEYEAVSTSENRRPDSILVLIHKVCKDAQIRINDVDEVFVNEGPGSYTGLKVGVSVANTLGFALGKKVNDKSQTLIKPKYE